MVSETAIEKQINDYLTQLTIKQKKAILNVVKTFAEEKEEVAWVDEEYIKEMNKRLKEMKTGKVKGYTLEETEERARQAYKSKKK